MKNLYTLMTLTTAGAGSECPPLITFKWKPVKFSALKSNKVFEFIGLSFINLSFSMESEFAQVWQP